MSDFLTEKSLEVQMKPSSILTYNQIESKRAFDQAAKDGNRVVLPEPDQLLLDIDGIQAWEKFEAQFQRFTELIDPGAYVSYDETSKSGKENHRHIIVNLTASVSADKRVLYQLMLGSDLRRELLSYVRFIEADPHPTLFIEKPKELPTEFEESVEKNQDLLTSLED